MLEMVMSTLEHTELYNQNLVIENYIQNIINMVHSLGMKLIAEGIEEKWQYEKLKTFDCDIIQGYYFSKPIPGSEVKRFNVS